MDFLGIGPLELVVILLILLIVMGPNDLVKMGRSFGRILRNLRQSDTWKAVQQATRELRSLPDNLARQANIDELKNLQKDLQGDLGSVRTEVEDLDKEFVAWTRKPESSSKAENDDSESSTDKK
jgi:Sec-independent protein translocase protein TatA